MADQKYEIRGDNSSGSNVVRADMKLEVVVIPVSDIDRAKEFYTTTGPTGMPTTWCASSQALACKSEPSRGKSPRFITRSPDQSVSQLQSQREDGSLGLKARQGS
jgi:hypothetical protein